MSVQSYYWHDYETFGTDPQRDRPVQFAGVRTDDQFNCVEEPLVVYLRPTDDCLPNPDACLITGITPQIADEKGLSEVEFIRLIHAQIAMPNTCTLGYNSLRFDDEVTRNCLYRNFYDPYAREWQNGNSRWDLIDVVRAARALRPDGINWPVNGEGITSFRLDQLTVANGITHQSAHDALSDVHATIAIAKLIRRVQPRLFQFLLHHRDKHSALELLKLGSFEPLVHVSGRFPAAKQCLAVVVPICMHPGNSNGVIVYDLSVDPGPMLDLTADEIRQRLFTATQDLPEGVNRIPLKTVHINKCPVLAPLSVIRPQDAERLGLDLRSCRDHLGKIKGVKNLGGKISTVFDERPNDKPDSDPDLSIYSGGFFSDGDKKAMARIRSMPPEQLAVTEFKFSDSRLPEMLFRYRARNYPDSLSEAEKSKWKDYCVRRLTGRDPWAGITFDDYFKRLRELENDENVNLDILKALDDYGLKKMQNLGLAESSWS